MTAGPAAHPVADLFPMLDGDDLYELTEDIKANGLLHPIVLDADGRILDGRNRFAACRAGGVEPTFTTYAGDDPDGYALSVNLARRNLSKGQRAMIAASSGLLESNNQGQAARSVGVSQSLIAQATTIRKHTPELAAGVVAGESFDAAYDKAVGVKKAKADEGARAAENVRRRSALQETEPQLAEQVAVGALTLVEAVDLAKERAAHRLRAAEQVSEWLGLAFERLGAYADDHDTAQRDVENFSHKVTQYRRPVERADLEQAAAGLARLIKLWRTPR